MPSSPTNSLGRRLRKLAAAIRSPDYRRALPHGVVAALEHEHVPFEHQYRTVLDVGANRGQFALFAMHRFPDARVLCFEPVPAARKKLGEVLSLANHDSRVFEFAATATDGVATIRVARDDAISSLLPPTPAQLEAFPASETVAELEVKTTRLDRAVTNLGLESPILLKVDVQGTELEVLRGSEALLEQIDTVLVEVSFVELFQGQAMADEVLEFLRSRSFRLTEFCSPIWDRRQRCLQADLLFDRAP